MQAECVQCGLAKNCKLSTPMFRKFKFWCRDWNNVHVRGQCDKLISLAPKVTEDDCAENLTFCKTKQDLFIFLKRRCADCMASRPV